MRFQVASFGVFIGLSLCGEAISQPDFSQVQVQVVPLRNGVYLLTGSGGNMGLCVGEDGAFLVDDQYGPLSAKILEAVRKVSDQPVRFVLNTHWHADHTGGNENLGKAGALIVAHENVRRRLSTEQFSGAFNRRVEPAPPQAWPAVTFSDAMTFHLNGEDVFVFHLAHAHTDGDSVVVFRKANVIHMGDLFFNGRYPFIDLSSGGSFAGLIAAVERVLAMVDDDARIIPGHGELTDKRGLQSYLSLLKAVRERVEPLVRSGKSVEEVLAARPLADLPEELGQGFMNPEAFLRIVYASLSGN
ncbi:MAG TPA: MBL fold metallo-hydrolase [Acidobacteriota bacterium]|nr:MBL fold metallo-hydrolase [Acidobacteriota bacterium]